MALGREKFLKPAQTGGRRTPRTNYGCPYDCGIVLNNEQHGCLTLLEITDNCNLPLPHLLRRSVPERQDIAV